MGRHADPTARRGPASSVLLLVAGLVVVLIAGGLVRSLAGGDHEDCRPRTVAVTVAPELGDLTERLLADPLPAHEGTCAVAAVTAQAPLLTVGDLRALDGDSVPDVWVPDSSLWTARAGEAELEHAGSLASSPVVLATGRSAADGLGWTGTPPSWGEALTGGAPLALPDLAASARGLSALAAVRASAAGTAEADDAVVQAVLAAARAGGPSPADALAAGRADRPDAALVPVSEQEVFAANAGAESPALVAVYPRGGSPSLDYPVLRVGAPTGARQAAVDAVVARLTSDRARAALRGAGFRGPDGEAPPGAGPGTGISEDAPELLRLDPAEVQALVARLSSSAAPSRILAAFDVSASMGAPVGEGTRATLARDAARSALTLVPDDFAVGLWVFAHRLEGGQDWAELVPNRELGAAVDGRTQRDVVADQLVTLPDRLAPGGTGLYDTILAAVRAARADYDPSAVNSVLVLTDGTDEDDAEGTTLPNLVISMAAEADRSRPVRVNGIALGPDADLGALQQIADATGGAAYSALEEEDLQAVLLDALRQRN